MKKRTILSIVFLLAGFFYAFPQNDSAQKKTLSVENWKKALVENDEFLHALKVMDNNIIENAKVLVHNMRTKKALFFETAKYHSDEIGRTLAASEDYLTQLQKKTDIAMDEIQVVYYAGLHQHYKKAIEESRALQDELIKATPATAVIEMEALTIYSEISKAESEQTDLERKMDIQEPQIGPQEKRR
jgi:hypothetical protein